MENKLIIPELMIFHPPLKNVHAVEYYILFQ